MRKETNREVMQLAQGYTAGKQRSKDSNSGTLVLESVCLTTTPIAYDYEELGLLKELNSGWDGIRE